MLLPLVFIVSPGDIVLFVIYIHWYLFHDSETWSYPTPRPIRLPVLSTPWCCSFWPWNLAKAINFILNFTIFSILFSISPWTYEHLPIYLRVLWLQQDVVLMYSKQVDQERFEITKFRRFTTIKFSIQKLNFFESIDMHQIQGLLQFYYRTRDSSLSNCGKPCTILIM